LFVGGCIFLGLFFFFAFLLAMTLISAVFDQDFAGEIFGYSPTDFAAYLLCAIALGGYGLAMLRSSRVKWVDRIALLRDIPNPVLVVFASIAAVPIILFIALMISIVASGGVD
jgi:hypothetical protein